MKPFKHVDAKSINEAVSLYKEGKGKAKVMAGGTDLLGVLKDRVLPTYPETVINLKTIPDLAYINEDSGGLKIGVLTKLRDVANSDVVKGKYKALADAALSVSSPHIRDMGTIGGNICQDVRCWYYRTSPWIGAPFICMRKGGKVCYALTGENRYHSIFGGPEGCYAVYPSDTAPALVALGAKFKTTKRTVEAKDFFHAITGTVLEPDEILTEIQVPTPAEGTTSSYTKWGIRRALDFAIVSVTCVITKQDKVCKDARIVLGGVAPIPWKATAAEKALVGKAISESSAKASATAALADAKPLKYNKYKVPVARTIVKRAILANR
ncbi:Aldehyde oxidoreductase FAD-binding subunit PaoB [subsurface metagenome]